MVEADDDDTRQAPEPRFVAVGYLDNRLHGLCFTPREGGIRVISFRWAAQRSPSAIVNLLVRALVSSTADRSAPAKPGSHPARTSRLPCFVRFTLSCSVSPGGMLVAPAAMVLFVRVRMPMLVGPLPPAVVELLETVLLVRNRGAAGKDAAVRTFYVAGPLRPGLLSTRLYRVPLSGSSRNTAGQSRDVFAVFDDPSRAYECCPLFGLTPIRSWPAVSP
ncbi:MAG: BrnT family toxin [Gammaproteobacteria bacterium]